MPIWADGPLQLHYDEHGSGPDLLLIHGGFSRGDVEWAELLPYVTDFRTIVPDIRGHGRSENPEPGFDRRGAGLDLAGLLTSLGVERAAVIAFSMGCHLALALTLARPELVERLILIGPVMEMDEQAARRFRRADPERAAIAGEPWAVTLKELHPPERWARLMQSLGDGVEGHPDWSQEELARIRCPTLVVAGDRDFYGAPGRQAERVAAAIPGARIEVLPGPHGIHRSGQGGDAAATGRLISGFLRS